MEKIKITKEQLNKLLSLTEPVIITNFSFTEIKIGNALECLETHEYYIITSCRKLFDIGDGEEYILPNPENTINLTNKNNHGNGVFTKIYSLEKLAGTMTIDLTKKDKGE